jgi:hypothetical protein
MRHDIRQTNGNTVMGTTYLVVSNSGLESHTVSLPLQDALLLTPGSTSTFRLGLQAERVLLSANSVTFQWPFAMTRSVLASKRQLIITVDGISYMVEVGGE